MYSIPVIAIFDIGKTNKKLFLFDHNYYLIEEFTAQFDEISDEDGFPCEDLLQLQAFVQDSLAAIMSQKKYTLKAVNVAAYGASFIYLDEHNNILTPLYNYLKPYPEKLKQEFYNRYGGEEKISLETASPVLGNLNSGMQLYRLKKEKPDIFKKMRYALHLPQYISYLITGKCVSDITSIGCHTQLWNYETNDYHQWVKNEGIKPRLAPIADSFSTYPVKIHGHEFASGIGLHDSSAALIPYFIQLKDPFLLLSTGTWSISLNPFNHTPLTSEELRNDCLCYLSYKGTPVKASRLFAGYEHEQLCHRISEHFNIQVGWYKSVRFNKNVLQQSLQSNHLFQERDLNQFKSPDEAYHYLIQYLVQKQFISSSLVLQNSIVNRIFVDGGFSKNEVYMNLLASVFPDKEVFAASMSHATALGAAMAIHSVWNDNPYRNGMIELTHYVHYT